MIRANPVRFVPSQLVNNPAMRALPSEGWNAMARTPESVPGEFGVFGKLIQLVTILVMTFFLLNDGKRIIAFAVRELGPERGERARRIGGDVYKAVGGYVAGNILISIIAGLLATNAVPGTTCSLRGLRDGSYRGGKERKHSELRALSNPERAKHLINTPLQRGDLESPLASTCLLNSLVYIVRSV